MLNDAGYKLLWRVFNRLNQQPGLYPGISEALNIVGGMLEEWPDVKVREY